MSSTMDINAMRADLGNETREDIYAAPTDGRGHLVAEDPVAYNALRQAAVQHREDAREHGGAKIVEWYNQGNFGEYDDGSVNHFAGQGHRQVPRTYQRAAGPGPAGRPAGGSSVRAASPRSLGHVRFVNGVRERVPDPQTNTFDINTAASRQAPRGSRQTTARSSTMAPGAISQPSRGPNQPMTAPRTQLSNSLHDAPRAPSQASRASSGGNSGRDSISHGRHTTSSTGATVESIIKAEIDELITAAKNGTLGDRFLPVKKDGGDFYYVTLFKIQITENSIKSSEPSDLIVQKGGADIFFAARKFLVNMTFQLVGRNDPTEIKECCDKFEDYKYEDRLLANVYQALKDAVHLDKTEHELREVYEGKHQLDVINQAICDWKAGGAQALHAHFNTFAGSGAGEAPQNRSIGGEDTTDMVIQVTTTVEQTDERINDDTTDEQEYGITTTVTGPRVPTGSIFLSGSIRDGGRVTGSSRPINILPAGIHASLHLQGDDAELTCHHMNNPEHLVHALKGLAGVLRGVDNMTFGQLETKYARCVADQQSAQVEVEPEAAHWSSMDACLEEDDEL